MIKKYNKFISQSVNEELFGLSKVEKLERRRVNLQNSLDKYLPIWIRKNSINVPSKSILDKFWEEAELDEYRSGDIVGGPGGVGIDSEGNLMYRRSDDVKTRGVGLEGVTENVDSDNFDSDDEDGLIFNREEIIEILSNEYNYDDLIVMSDDDLMSLWDKMETDDWIDDQD